MNEDIQPPRPHELLLGLEDDALLALAPAATHQQRRGGLYRRLGPILLASDRTPVLSEGGEPLIAWLHCHPYGPEVLARPESDDAKFRPLKTGG